MRKVPMDPKKAISNRLKAVAYVKKAFPDTDVDVIIARPVGERQFRLVIDLDFGQPTNCYCCQVIDGIRLRNEGPPYIKELLDKMIQELKTHTGRA
jgi:hypothetical protein